jgi:electron transport complex protein RnfC
VPGADDPQLIGKHVRRGEPLSSGPNQCLSPADGMIESLSNQPVLGGGTTPTAVLKIDTPEVLDTPPITDEGSARTTLERLAGGNIASGIDALLAGGVTADRWVSPDLLGQLRMVAQRRVKTILCSALDLDPAVPVQRLLAAESAMDIAVGAAGLAKLAGATQVFLAVPEDLAPAGIAALRTAAATTGVRLYPLPNEYPLANPSLLIRRVTGKRLKPGKLPPEVGVVMLDAPAAVAVGRCFVHGEPMLRVPLGVYDRERAQAHLLSVPVGMKVGDVLAALEISSGFRELRSGHVLRDIPTKPDAIVAGAELTVFASASHPVPMASACLRCGWCVEACPVRIHPAGLLEAAQQRDPQIAEHSGIQSCIECGICGYVCPSRLPLLPAIRALRSGN